MRVIMNFEHRCSMRCEWCYIPFRAGAPNRVQSMSVLRRLISRGVKVITIGGGDPTSYPFWSDLAREARSSGLFVHLDTNGIGLRMDSETAKTISQTVDLLGLPLDGPTAGVHDAMRSMVGHFDQILEKVRWAVRQGAQIKLNTIVSRVNIDAVPQMLKLVQELAPKRWSLYQYWPLSHGATARLSHDVDNYEFESMVEKLPYRLGETIIEPNSRLSRRLTYPIVSHAGDVYVHSRENIEKFDFLGSIFEHGPLDRALELCAGDRLVAVSRYSLSQIKT
jgi:MoaA/NifB/PqqE/SkfB family radical SAM enzyme